MESLSWAVKNGELNEVKALLKENKGFVSERYNGRPPLCVAADYGQREMLDLLIKEGAEVNQADKHGITPLLSAIYEGHTECVKFLLEKGADYKTLRSPSGDSYADCAEKQEIKDLLK